MSNYNILFDAEAAVQEVVPRVVERHRAKGILAWNRLHRLEEEVMSEVSSSGRFSKRLNRDCRRSFFGRVAFMGRTGSHLS